MSCISTKNLTKSYNGVNAVDGINLSIDSGQVFGFLGPNGAGKSTSIKLLTTLIPPSSGSITILGIDALKHPLDVRHKIGVVLQQPSYEPPLTVEKSLDKYGMMWDVPKSLRKERLEQLLEEFDLVQIRKKKNEDLSIGQRRRVQVAREFMHDVKLLFLDEPTIGLDPSARRGLLDYLKRKIKTGMTIFYTTHVLTEAEYLCDKIAIIHKGKILTVDTPSSLKNKFGKKKIITITLKHHTSLLSDIEDCTIHDTNVVINSERAELILQKVLRILLDNDIEITNISAIPTNLEDIFLELVK